MTTNIGTVCFVIEGMTGAMSERRVREAVGRVPGAICIFVTAEHGLAVAEYDVGLATPVDIGHALEHLGFAVRVVDNRPRPEGQTFRDMFGC